MSGHSKWNSIRHQKAAADSKRGKVFTRHANLITLAARGGGDPNMNPGLRLAIDNAKRENMPNNNIDRAIKKGTGDDKDAAQFFEIVYEGYAPSGVAVLVECLTDNKNRTVASVRSTFSKNGGNLGESGSVAFLFSKKGIILVENPSEELEMIAIEAEAEDVEITEDTLEVTTDHTHLFAVKKALEEAGAQIRSAEFQLIPSTTVEISDEIAAGKVIHLVQALEENEDVTSVSANFDIPEEVLEKVLG